MGVKKIFEEERVVDNEKNKANNRVKLMSSLGATLWYQIWKIKTGRPPKDFSARRWIILDKMLNKFLF